MYRIIQYRNGRYVAQKNGRYGWFKIGGVFNHRGSAERCIDNDKIRWAPYYRPEARVVGYY